MKKSLLKASLICLGAILLCGLSSFKSLEGENLQRFHQTAAISNDTIITPDVGRPQCIKKEVVVEGDMNGCTCTLEVIYKSSTDWALRVKKSSLTEKDVVVTYSYKTYGLNGHEESFFNKKAFIRSDATNIQEDLDHGTYMEPFDCNDSNLKVCELISLSACFYVDPNSNQ